MAFCARLFPGGASGSAERVLALSLAFDFRLTAVVVSPSTTIYLKGALAILHGTWWVIAMAGVLPGGSRAFPAVARMGQLRYRVLNSTKSGNNSCSEFMLGVVHLVQLNSGKVFCKFSVPQALAPYTRRGSAVGCCPWGRLGHARRDCKSSAFPLPFLL